MLKKVLQKWSHNHFKCTLQLVWLYQQKWHGECLMFGQKPHTLGKRRKRRSGLSEPGVIFPFPKNRWAFFPPGGEVIVLMNGIETTSDVRLRIWLAGAVLLGVILLSPWIFPTLIPYAPFFFPGKIESLEQQKLIGMEMKLFGIIVCYGNTFW